MAYRLRSLVMSAAWKRRGLALTSGLLTTLSVPPFGWWPLGIIGLGLGPLALRLAGRARERFSIGALFALGLYVPSLWWMTQFSLPGGIIIALIETVLSALVITFCVPAFSGEWHRSLSWTAAIVGADALRSLWPFGGLPLGGIDLGQADGPLASVVPFGGRLLLIGVTTLLGCCVISVVHAVLRDRRLARGGPALIGSGVVMFVSLCALLPDGTHVLRPLRIAAVQGSGPLGLRATPEGLNAAFRRHLDATRELVKKPVDLVVWPENVTDVFSFANSTKRAEVGALATELNASIIVGVVEAHPDPKLFRNLSTVVQPGNVLGESYEKVRRVPFGEYVYFRSILERFNSHLQKKDMKQGTKPGVIGTRFGPMAITISYEGFFDDRARSGVRKGGQALLIPTNAASFTSAHLPSQQIAAARLRARETGRWVVQAAPTGFSAILRPDGSTVIRSGIQQRVALQHTITLRSGLTPYARFNDLPALILFGFLGLMAYVLARRQTTSTTRSR